MGQEHDSAVGEPSVALQGKAVCPSFGMAAFVAYRLIPATFQRIQEQVLVCFARH